MDKRTDDIYTGKKALSSALWKFSERLAAQLVSFVVSIILARLLSPNDYGIVGMVAIFFAFANVLIFGGLNTALIQKKGCDFEDYSTILIASSVVSVICYFILFFSAPNIANLLREQSLVLIIRIMGLTLPITAIKSVWCAYISSHLQFKKFFFSTLTGTIVSAIVGIVMAYSGFGVWALIVQQMLNTFLDTLILILSTHIKIVFRFNFKKFKELFGYGWKILLSSLLGTAFTQLNPIVIAIRFTSSDLSYYTKGKSFPDIINSVTTNTLSAVLFPFLSKFQEDKKKVLDYTRKYMQVSSLIVFPMMLGMLAISSNFIHVLLTDKWMGASYFIKIFCLSYMFDIVAIGNCESIKALGKSGVYLIMEIIKKASYFVILLLFVIFGNSPQILATSAVFCTMVQILVNSIPNRRILGYKYKEQLLDLLPSLICSLIMCCSVFLVGFFSSEHGLLTLIKQIIIGISVYSALTVCINNKVLLSLKSIIQKNK